MQDKTADDRKILLFALSLCNQSPSVSLTPGFLAFANAKVRKALMYGNSSPGIWPYQSMKWSQVHHLRALGAVRVAGCPYKGLVRSQRALIEVIPYTSLLKKRLTGVISILDPTSLFNNSLLVKSPLEGGRPRKTSCLF